ncbi:MAG TPA: class I SAM-dependent methyltransferase [Vicinamibacterales bacterium]|nr:class I SAM-dependent methyltransferase [Vicinamibacterales bacterium]
MTLKQMIPWWSKIAGKIVLSRLPAGYRVWERMGLFVHGAMDRPDYAWRVVTEHVARAGWADLAGRVVVELGPGDSLATAMIARALGAREVWLVDAGAFARMDLAPYVRLAALLRASGLTPPAVESFSGVQQMLEACGARYETTGLDALRRIPDHSVDLVFSQAVLEHIRLEEFDPLLVEMHRVLKPDGVASHQIDLKDHLAASLNHLRFMEEVWESDFMTRSGFYTNRLRLGSIVARFHAAGFSTRIDDVRRWPAIPLPRRALAPPFRSLPDDELTVSQFDIVARPS